MRDTKKFPRKKTRGRPSLPIDWKEVARLLSMRCLGTDIAARFGISCHTLYDRCVVDKSKTFSEFMAECRAVGDSLVREKQFEKAIEGDTTLLMFWGKNYLGQRSEPAQDSDSENKLADLRGLARAIQSLREDSPKVSTTDASVRSDSQTEPAL